MRLPSSEEDLIEIKGHYSLFQQSIEKMKREYKSNRNKNITTLRKMKPNREKATKENFTRFFE